MLKISGIAKGKKLGKAEGKIEARKETAQILLNDGFDIEFIMKVTHLTKNEIEEIKNSQN